MLFRLPKSSNAFARSSQTLDEDLRAARDVLRDVWGYVDFRPAQLQAIRQVVQGKDGLVLMPTGGGKSIAFQVPALVRGGLTIVISPLISLMQDQVGMLAGLGILTFALTGRLGFDVAGYVNRRIHAEPAFLLYMAPERVGTPLFERMIRGIEPRLIVVDEAHCISSWGHDFRPGYRHIASLRSAFASGMDIPCVAFTATATPRVVRDIQRSLRLKRPFRIQSSFQRSNLSFSISKCVDPTMEVLRLLRQFAGSSIVYDSSRSGTEVWAEKLRRAGFSADAYHAGLTPADRSRIQADWLRGRIRTVVATNAFGMGIDKPDVRLVLHVGIPESLEGWYQQAGRAGRDGRPAMAVLFDTPDARKARKALIKGRAKARFAAMCRWLGRDACRTWGVLAYFGESAPEHCGQCDYCDPGLLSLRGYRPEATSRARL